MPPSRSITASARSARLADGDGSGGSPAAATGCCTVRATIAGSANSTKPLTHVLSRFPWVWGISWIPTRFTPVWNGSGAQRNEWELYPVASGRSRCMLRALAGEEAVGELDSGEIPPD
jgi:hypothetical protein